MDAEIPADVLHLLEEQIDTVPHLEALLLIWNSGTRSWTADEIATRIYVSTGVAANLLQDLARRRLLVSDGASPASYTFHSGHETAAALMPRVAAAYRQNLVLIARLIHAKGSPAVREFARAFEFKKE